MQLPTYTSMFRHERKLYAIYDFELPAPVSLFQAGAFVVSLAVVYAVLQLLGIPLNAFWAFAYLVPPGVAAWLASQPVADGKRAHHWLGSQIRYLTEAKTLCRLRPYREPQVIHLRAVATRRRRR